MGCCGKEDVEEDKAATEAKDAAAALLDQRLYILHRSGETNFKLNIDPNWRKQSAMWPRYYERVKIPVEESILMTVFKACWCHSWMNQTELRHS